jgi:hypothetical protein
MEPIGAFTTIKSGFGGLEVACWPLVPKFAGSNLAEAAGIFGAKKVKPLVPCRRFAACKRTLWFMWKSESRAKLSGHFSPYFRPSLTEVSHVAWHGVPVEMTDGTNWRCTKGPYLRSRCIRGGIPETATSIYHLPSTTIKRACHLSLSCAFKVYENNKSNKIYNNIMLQPLLQKYTFFIVIINFNS